MLYLWLSLPFLILLLIIALLPTLAPHFWESNRNRAFLVFILSAPLLIWLIKHEPLLLQHSLHEYFSFIVLLTSLYVISGGISLTGDLKATPSLNTAFLAFGAILANIIGTTGASMVLIRAFLKTNSERHHTHHLPVFFIFIVSNCAGLLTPLGDQPLFLGYLKGVPFFWTLKLWPMWLLTIGLLLLIFYFWDKKAYKSETKKDLKKDAQHILPLRLKGKRHLLILSGIIGGVFLPTPWREMIMLSLTLLSLAMGPKVARRENKFSWAPILEVAILFASIFITMVPAMEFIKNQAPTFGITKPWHFFWATGLLSGALDNAPTYLTFFTLAQGLNLPAEIVGVSENVLKAISLGAVFMGANTYIGNGPNFMVRSIADHAGFKTPSFFGYTLYAACILLPIYFLIHFLFII